jgi:hypothetical protein
MISTPVLTALTMYFFSVVATTSFRVKRQSRWSLIRKPAALLYGPQSKGRALQPRWQFGHLQCPLAASRRRGPLRRAMSKQALVRKKKNPLLREISACQSGHGRLRIAAVQRDRRSKIPAAIKSLSVDAIRGLEGKL